MKINAKTDNGMELKDFFNALDILSDYNLHIDKDGIHVKQMEPSTIAAADANLEKGAFSQWDVTEGDISINKDNLKPILKLIKKNTGTIKINTIDKEGNPSSYLRFSFGKGSVIDVPYLMGEKSKELKIPNLKLNTKFAIPASQIKESLNQTKARNIFFVIQKDKLVLFAKDDNDIKTKNTIQLPSKIKEKISAAYNTEYLKKMLKGAGKDTEVKFELNNEEPLKLSYGGKYWHAEEWLAPYTIDDKNIIKEVVKESLNKSGPQAVKKKKTKVRA